jgi:hypothetical protein
MGSAVFSYKSESCKHADGCLMNTVKTAVNALKYGVCIEIGRQLTRVILLLFRKRNVK